MTPLFLAACQAHARTRGYQRKEEALHDLMRQRDPAKTYVGFSAGKDSTVCAHACHQAHPGIAMLMVDPGCPTHWLEEERQFWVSYAEAQRWALTLFPWDKWRLQTDQEDISAYQATIHADMFHDLSRYADTHDLTTRVMGLRQEESRARGIMLARKGPTYLYADGKHGAVCPLAQWRWQDVWAYLVRHNLPWLSIYDRLGPQARNGLVGRSGESQGRWEYLREAYPAVWRWARQQEIAP